MFTNESLLLTSRSRRRAGHRSAWGYRRVTVPVFVPQIDVEPPTHISESDVPSDGDTTMCDACGHHYARGELFILSDYTQCYQCKVLSEAQIA